MTVHTQQQVLQDPLLQDQLEIQAQQAESAYTQHNQMPAKPFNVQSPLSTGWQRLRGLKHDFIHALAKPDVAAQKPIVQEVVQEDQLQVEGANSYEPPVALLDLMEMIPSLPTVTAVLGLAEDGRPVLLNFNSGDISHVLISGDDKAGKTTLLRTIATSLALSNKQSVAQLIVIDLAPESGVAPESGATESSNPLQSLNHLPHMLADVASKPAEIKEMLTFLANELGYRQKKSIKSPRIVALIDKADQLFTDDFSESVDALRHLARRGAMAGIHLIVAAENDSHPALSKNLKPYCPLRIVGLTAKNTAVTPPTPVTTDNDASELLGEGDFLAIVGRTAPQITHFQAAYIGNSDLHLSIQRMPQQKAVLLARPYQSNHEPAEPTPQRISIIQQIPKPTNGFVSL